MVYFDVAYDWMMVATTVGTWECALLDLSFPALIPSSSSKIAFSFFSNRDIQVSHDYSDFMWFTLSLGVVKWIVKVAHIFLRILRCRYVDNNCYVKEASLSV